MSCFDTSHTKLHALRIVVELNEIEHQPNEETDRTDFSVERKSEVAEKFIKNEVAENLLQEESSQASLANARSNENETQQYLGKIVADRNCQMLVRERSGRVVVVLTVPERDGARVVVTDDRVRGLATVVVPLLPRRIQVGIDRDGISLLAISGLESRRASDADARQGKPLRIFRGSGQIYESESVLDFAVAADGRSYFVVESLAGGESRLIVRNFDLGTERHYDLGTAFIANFDETLGAQVRYSYDGSEIEFIPRGGGLERIYRFFSVSNDTTRRVKIRLPNLRSGALFHSSSELYILSMSERREYGNAVVTKYGPARENRWALLEQWSRSLDMARYSGQLTLASEGDMLVVDADSAPHVLMTSTGEMVESTPVWPESLRDIDDRDFLLHLMSVAETSISPTSGLTYRHDLAENNRYLWIKNSPVMPASIQAQSRYWGVVLDLDAEGYSNRPEETVFEGYPVPCEGKVVLGCCSRHRIGAIS